MVTRTMKTVTINVSNGTNVICALKDYGTTVTVLKANGLEVISTEEAEHKYAMTDAEFLMHSTRIDMEDNK